MSSNNPVGHIERLTFSGKGSEYFRIWIVNLALSILTLGIYSAWAKVRRLKYFYQNTRLADSSFDFHGDPLAILKGRVIAVILLLAYNFSGMISPQAALATLALLVLVFPWLIVRRCASNCITAVIEGCVFHSAARMPTDISLFFCIRYWPWSPSIC